MSCIFSHDREGASWPDFVVTTAACLLFDAIAPHACMCLCCIRNSTLGGQATETNGFSKKVNIYSVFQLSVTNPLLAARTSIAEGSLKRSAANCHGPTKKHN